jgi:exodeoxyribonuclease VII large subunit
LVSLRREEAIARLFDADRRARAALATRLEYSRLRWDGVRRRAPLTRPVEVIERQRQRLDDLQARLLRARGVTLQRWQHRLSLAAGKLQGLSPLSTLARGYAVVTRLPEHAALTSVEQVKPGDRVRMRLADGSVDAEVLQVREEATERDEKSDE